MGADYPAALISLIKTVNGRDKLYKMIVNYCKLLIIYKLAQEKGAADKLQKVVADCRTVMRLGAWIENAKKIQGIVVAGKVTVPTFLEFFAALTGGTYKYLDNLKLLLSKGVPIPGDQKSVANRAKWWQFWQYVFGVLAALLGKDGYFDSSKALAKASKAGNTADEVKARAKMTKATLKAMHHFCDFLATLPNVGYVPAYKPSAGFVAGCGFASGTIVSYLQWDEQVQKTLK